MDLSKLKAGKDVAKGLVNAFIEIPLGSDIKYELDKEQGVIVADRFMFTALKFYLLDSWLFPRVDPDSFHQDLCIFGY